MQPMKIEIPASISESIFRQHAKGEMDSTDYFIMSASWTAENTHKFRAKSFPQISASNKAYSESRCNAACGYSPELAKSLNIWINLCARIFIENESDRKHLIWCKEKCESAKLTEHVKKLDTAIENFMRFFWKDDDYTKALECLKLDLSQKGRG